MIIPVQCLLPGISNFCVRSGFHSLLHSLHHTEFTLSQQRWYYARRFQQGLPWWFGTSRQDWHLCMDSQTNSVLSKIFLLVHMCKCLLLSNRPVIHTIIWTMLILWKDVPSSLLCPNKLRSFGTRVDYCPTMYESRSSHGLTFHEQETGDSLFVHTSDWWNNFLSTQQKTISTGDGLEWYPLLLGYIRRSLGSKVQFIWWRRVKSKACKRQSRILRHYTKTSVKIGIFHRFPSQMMGSSISAHAI